MPGSFERSALAFLAGTLVIVVVSAILSPSPRSPFPKPPASELAPRTEPAPEAPRFQYDLEAVAAGAPVPRALSEVFLDPAAGSEAGASRNDDLRSLLPAVLLANEEVLSERRQLWEIRFRLDRGERLPPQHRIWLEVIADHYGAAANDLEELLRRVDVVPPSILLAAASEALTRQRQEMSKRERGAAARTGKSKSKQIVQSSRDARSRKLASPELHKTPFAPIEHTRTLIRTLNTDPAYESFRRERAKLRRAAAPLDGMSLAGALPKAGDGAMRSGHISGVIAAERLARFDNARLEPSRPMS